MCCFCEVILFIFGPNKYYFDNIAILATIGRILSEKVKKSTIFWFFQISKSSKICYWCSITTKLHRYMGFDGIWMKNVKSTIFDVVKWACRTITRFITRFKVKKWRFLKFLLATFKIGLCLSKAMKNRICIRFCSEVESFVIFLFNLRFTEVFFAVFWQFEKRPKSTIKNPLKIDSGKPPG